MALVKYNNRSILNVTALGSIASGDLNLITTNTISSAVSSSSFTSNIDSTYDTYLFKYINIHPGTDNADFTFNMSADGGSNYNVTKTTIWYGPYHNEAGNTAALSYEASNDLAQNTGYQILAKDPEASSADGSINGELFLFNPSSTTFVKHYMTIANSFDTSSPPYTQNQFSGGYCNTTSAVNAVRFKFSSGNTDSGTIKLYGIRDS